MKSSITSRSLKLLGLATSVGRKELAQNIKDQFVRGVDEIASGRVKTRLEQAKLIAESLSQLKGAAMKAGQLLSLDAADYFPPEAIEILSKLQGQAEPVPWEVMRETLLADLGEEKLKNFAKLDERAAASASIGQVHRGVWRTPEGLRDVAVKIQYPGVADSIDSDLAILRTLGQSLLSITGKKMDLKELFEELAIVLKQEADYEREAANMAEFRKLAADYPEFVVPEPLFATKHVLIMSWEKGRMINDWLKRSPPKQDREHIGRMALDLFCKEFFEWGLVQTDPNFANFLVQDTEEPGQEPARRMKLVALDFGAAIHYTEEFRRDYVDLLKALSTLDRETILAKFRSSGLIDARESEETFQLLADLLMNSLEPFQPHRQPFRFRDEEYSKATRETGQRFTQSLKYSAPPRRILFLHRKLGGLFTLLKKLDVEMDVLPYWKRMVGAELGPQSTTGSVTSPKA